MVNGTRRHQSLNFLISGMVVLWTCCCPVVVVAQVPGIFGNRERYEESAEKRHARRLPNRPLTLTSFKKGQLAIEDGDVSDGLQTLQLLLDESHDFFLKDSETIHGSLANEIEQVLIEHHDEYERLFGRSAQQLLKAAMQQDDFSQLADVSRRFAMTSAGYEATQHLANALRDRGDYAASARLWERLATHPSEKNRQARITAAAELYAAAQQSKHAIKMAQQQLNDAEAQTLEQHLTDFARTSAGASQLLSVPPTVKEWRMPFGSAGQFASSEFAPLSGELSWSVDDLDIFDFTSYAPTDRDEAMLKQARDFSGIVSQRVRSEKQRAAFPVGVPLVIGDTVLYRGDGTLKAVDLTSGELRWVADSFVESTFEELNKSNSTAEPSAQVEQDEMRELFSSLRDWRDMTMGSISTDGEHVFVITDCQLPGSINSSMLVQTTSSHPLFPQRRNRLHAYSIADEGRTMWIKGYATGDYTDLDSSVNRDIYFLGPPVMVNGSLYVLGEERSQTELFELDPATGEVIWSIGLLNPDMDILLSNDRRLAGLSPTYGGGLLYCPSGDGVVTAIDPIQRRVVWTASYDQIEAEPRRAGVLVVRRTRNESLKERIREFLDDKRWFDSRILFAGESIIMTPPDDSALICFHSSTGKVLWRHDQASEQSLYAATLIQDETHSQNVGVVVVGRKDISALRLDNGTPLWSQSVPIPIPAGRGVRMGDQFLQPLVTGEIAVVDLKHGRLSSRIPLPSEAGIGNLVSAQGRLLMQTATGVVSLQSMSEVEPLLANGKISQDEMAGIIAIQKGELTTGIESLRQAIEKSKSERARHVLAWNLVEGLRTDFESHRSMTEEIDRILSTPEQRLRFLMYQAQGLHQSGDAASALKHYFSLFDIADKQSEPLDMNSQWSVSLNRWVLGEVSDLLSQEQGSPAVQKPFHEWLDRATEESSILQACRIPTLANAQAEAPFERVEKIPVTSSNALMMEQVLVRYLQSKSQKLRLRALMKNVELSLAVKNNATALQSLEVLQHVAANAPEPTMKSVNEFVSTIRLDEKHASQLLAVPKWPQHVEVAETSDPMVNRSRYLIGHLGPVSPVLQGWSFQLDNLGTNIEIINADGKRVSRFPTGVAGSIRSPMGQYLGRYVSTRGHLALVVLSDKFFVVDCLSGGTPSVLHSHSLSEEEQSSNRFRTYSTYRQVPRPGFRTLIARTMSGNLAGNVGPLTSSTLCYTSGNTLIAIDPVSGKELWRQLGIPDGAEILGDDETVLLKAPNVPSLNRYSAIDGRSLGKPVPMPQGLRGLMNSKIRRGGDWGRLIPTFEMGPQTIWKMHDPVANKIAWQRPLPPQSVWAPVDGKDIAFVTPDHQLTVHNGMTGDVLFEVDLPIQFIPKRVSVLSFDNQWIVIAEKETDEPPELFASQNTSAHLSSPLDGVVIAIEKSGNTVQWNQPIQGLGFPFDQPTHWPILCLVNDIGRSIQARVLHRATGETILHEQWINGGSGTNWEGITQPMTIRLRFDRQTINLNCTDPLPPKSEQPVAEPKTP